MCLGVHKRVIALPVEHNDLHIITFLPEENNVLSSLSITPNSKYSAILSTNDAYLFLTHTITPPSSLQPTSDVLAGHEYTT